MSTPWVISSVLQWAVIAVLGVLVLSLVRQLGILSIRLNPSVGLDLDEGPGPGSELLAQDVPLLNGHVYQFGGQRVQPSLTIFLSPDCSICNSVSAYFLTLARRYSRDELAVLAVVNANPRTAREYVRDHELTDVPVALKQNFPTNHGIHSTPYAVAVTADGTVAARGVPNALEHLEEMVKKARELPDGAEGLDVRGSTNSNEATPASV